MCPYARKKNIRDDKHMLRFQMISRYPDYISHDKLHVVTTRQTLFGVHQPYYAKDQDIHCTKTNIISFLRHEDAYHFKRTLENFQQLYKHIPDRVMDGSLATYRKTGSIMPLSIDSIHAKDLEQLCSIHWFNMLVVHHVHDGYEPFHDIYECFLYDTPPPKKDVILLYLQNMYRH